MARTQKSASPGSTISLGAYTFRLQVDDTTGGPAMEITATCYNVETGKYATATKQFDTGSKVLSWEIEAGDTEASVYAQVSHKSTTIVDVDLSTVGSMSYSYGPWSGFYWPDIAVWADFPARVSFSGLDAQTASPITLSYYAPKDIYCGSIDINGQSSSPIYGPVALDYHTVLPQGQASQAIAEFKLIGRFAINLEDAGGYPGGSGNWDVPGDWNPDPSTTLHLTVSGALSGRHNDPLNDTSYSYVPADNTTEAGYGCGGDGGHGGGGGGGASTSIVRQFATNKANSKDIVITVKRHGYGSGGSKGAKGGDGCILIYY